MPGSSDAPGRERGVESLASDVSSSYRVEAGYSSARVAVNFSSAKSPTLRTNSIASPATVPV